MKRKFALILIVAGVLGIVANAYAAAPPNGTGFGMAQDASLQNVLFYLKGQSGVYPAGGTGVGLAQDATLQQIITAIQASPSLGVGTAGQALFTNAAGNASVWTSLSGDASGSLVTPGSISVTGLNGGTQGSFSNSSGDNISLGSSGAVAKITNTQVLFGAPHETLAQGAGNQLTDDVTSGGKLQTTNGTITTIFTFAVPDNTLITIVAKCLGRNNANTGDAYYTELQETVQRFGGAAPSLVGAAAAATNTKTNGTTTGWVASMTRSSNNELVQVTGAGSTTINWSCQTQVEQVQ